MIDGPILSRQRASLASSAPWLLALGWGEKQEQAKERSSAGYCSLYRKLCSHSGLTSYAKASY